MWRIKVAGGGAMDKRFGILQGQSRRFRDVEQRILQLRYGGWSRCRSYREVGALLGLSPIEVRRLERTALERLRHVGSPQLVWDEA